MEHVQRSGLDAVSSIEAVKASVISTLRATDDSVRIHKTEYFNHTYAPDLVLTWAGLKADRKVYLRTTDREQYLAEDIQLLQQRDPMIMPLDGIQHDSVDAAMRSLNNVSQSVGALVAETSSLTSLGESLGSSPVRNLASRAVLQGGKGLVDGAGAVNFGEAVSAGFSGALNGEVESTAGAVRAAEEILDPARTAALSELLQAAWVGGGNTSTSFPGTMESPASLGPDTLALLLDTVPGSDPEFWAHIARRLELGHLSGLSVSAENEAFQALLRAAAPRLVAKAARLVESDSDRVDGLRWGTAHGLLTLLVGTLRVQFADRSQNEFASSGTDLSPSATRFRARAQANQTTVLRIVLASDDRRLEFVSEDGTSLVADNRIDRLEEQLGVAAKVRRAVVETRGPEMTVDFSSSTVGGNTSAKFSVQSLTDAVAGLLVDRDNEVSEHVAVAFPET
ncbi:hypothetical protein N8K70_03025 [Microbacterium betulae]|uniref:Uncharacterized protein n=1 Tax=Microbacterium betulae TaxID=2981139 RepID=A0AA97FI40_9MICO|nr:hypothetical protein [Microbacterium sp. AB]WOF23666.1 hypothetical protein N8K70_03025 [Microbacterium sp. AB]